MKTLIFITLTLFTISSYSQDFDLGKSKEQIEEEIKSKKGNISYGMNNEGFAFIMDEDWDGFTAWYLDDDSNCIAFYSVIRSEQGRKKLIEFKLSIAKAKDSEKVDNNTYLLDDLYFKFTNEPNNGIGFLVSKKLMNP